MISELSVKLIVFALVIIFFLIRSRFIKHYKKFTPRTLIKYIILVVLFFFYFLGYFDFALLNLNIFLRIFGGLLVILIGFLFFIWAHKHLGENWSPIIEKKFSKSRKIITSGPYRYIRHPIYAASFITLIGFFMLSANWLLVGIPLIILILFYASKIPREEGELIANFGKKYLDYKKITGGLIPK